MSSGLKLALAVVVAAVFTSPAGLAEADSTVRADSVYAFVGVNVVPMDSERLIRDQTVVVRGEWIEVIGPSASTEVPEDAIRIDGRGKYLMPGLAEMHAHIPGPNAGRAFTERVLFLYVANGITTIRGMLGNPIHLELREEAAAGEILSPRIYTSGPSFNGNSVSSPEQARRMVIEQKEAGYDFLKLHPDITRANYDAIVVTADSVGITFAGHISTGVGLERTLEARQATIDHLDGYVEAMAMAGGSPIDPTQSQFFGLNLVMYADDSAMPELAAMTRQAGVWNVPTQSLFPDYMGFTDPVGEGRPDLKYMPSQFVTQWSNRAQDFSGQVDSETALAFIETRRMILKALHDAGAGILLGSDAPQVFQVPGFSMHEELTEYVAAGLTPFEALETGTVNVARFYDAEDERGTVAAGMVADLILLDGNPLERVSAVRDPAGVMLRGTWLSGGEIAERLQALAGS